VFEMGYKELEIDALREVAKGKLLSPSRRRGAPYPTTCRFLVRLRRNTELQAHVISNVV